MEEVNEEIKNLSILVENVENNSRNKKKYIERQKAMDKIETQLTRPVCDMSYDLKLISALFFFYKKKYCSRLHQSKHHTTTWTII